MKSLKNMMSKSTFALRIKKDLKRIFDTETPSRKKWREYKFALARKFRRQFRENQQGLSASHFPVKKPRPIARGVAQMKAGDLTRKEKRAVRLEAKKQRKYLLKWPNGSEVQFG
jgi:DNA-binding helix-hairpin-helix protein with protein kinase domain